MPIPEPTPESVRAEADKVWTGASRQQRFVISALVLIVGMLVTLTGLVLDLEDPPAPPPGTTTTTVAPTTTAPTTVPPSASTTTTTAGPTTTTTPPSQVTFPTEATTGPTGTLSSSGSITTTKAGQVIENKRVNGRIQVNHPNVVIRNVEVNAGGGTAIYINASETDGATNLVVENSLLDCGRGGDPAIAEHNYTLRRVEVRNCGEGPRINGNVTIEDSLIWKFTDAGADAHQDCIQVTSGYDIVIRHNVCIMDFVDGNAAVMIGTWGGGRILLENNLLGGGGYTVFAGSEPGYPDNYTDVVIRNNRITTQIHPKGGYWGPFTSTYLATLSGNVWHDGPNAGQPIP